MPKALSEPEVIYLINLYKDKIAKYRSDEAVEQTYQQAALTAKLLTQEMVEGNTPICQIIARHTESKLSREEVMLILYRCKQLYTVRTEVQKILHLLIKALYDPVTEAKTAES